MRLTPPQRVILSELCMNFELHPKDVIVNAHLPTGLLLLDVDGHDFAVTPEGKATDL